MLRDTRGTRLDRAHSASPRRRSGSISKYREYDNGYSESDDEDRCFDRSFDRSFVPPDDPADNRSFSDLPESPIKKTAFRRLLGMFACGRDDKGCDDAHTVREDSISNYEEPLYEKPPYEDPLYIDISDDEIMRREDLDQHARELIEVVPYFISKKEKAAGRRQAEAEAEWRDIERDAILRGIANGSAHGHWVAPDEAAEGARRTRRIRRKSGTRRIRRARRG